jgi:hypothetical protein
MEVMALLALLVLAEIQVPLAPKVIKAQQVLTEAMALQVLQVPKETTEPQVHKAIKVLLA